MSVLAPVKEQIDCYRYGGKKPQNEDDGGGDVGRYGDGDRAYLQGTHC